MPCKYQTWYFDNRNCHFLILRLQLWSTPPCPGSYVFKNFWWWIIRLGACFPQWLYRDANWVSTRVWILSGHTHYMQYWIMLTAKFNHYLYLAKVSGNAVIRWKCCDLYVVDLLQLYEITINCCADTWCNCAIDCTQTRFFWMSIFATPKNIENSGMFMNQLWRSYRKDLSTWQHRSLPCEVYVAFTYLAPIFNVFNTSLIWHASHIFSSQLYHAQQPCHLVTMRLNSHVLTTMCKFQMRMTESQCCMLPLGTKYLLENLGSTFMLVAM